jgi:exodeoxyribonuclease V alpha subunit
MIKLYRANVQSLYLNPPEQKEKVEWKHTRMAHSKREFLKNLQKLGVPKYLADQAYYELGMQSDEVITRDPYQLLRLGDGYLWQTVDQLAQRLGFDEFSPERLCGGILCALKGSTSDGHIYIPQRELLQRVNRLIPLEDPSALDKALASLQEREQIHSQRQDGRLVFYLDALFEAEVGVAKKLKHLHESSSRVALKSPAEQEMQQVERELNVTLAPEQWDAIAASLENKIVIITGGPGTGKTTIIRGVLHLWEQYGVHIRLAAPTGRAARRLRESTGRDKTFTIHRLLEFNPDTRQFNRDETRKLKADLLVIDEASMIDIELMYSLLRALPPHCHLLLVGDVDQLPSVGPGSVLHDLISCCCIKTIRLQQIYRQQEGSLISLNAKRINEGELPELTGEGIEEGQDFFFISRNSNESTQEAVLEMVTDRIPKRFDLNPKEDIQVLSPMHKKEVGVETMNTLLQKVLNPADQYFNAPFYAFTIGDKVMQIKNDYEKDVFNGDIGYISHVNQRDHSVMIEFDGENKKYFIDEMVNTALAYAITVHKSQGSEYPAVVIPLTMQHYPMLQRNLIYTAVSRGKRLVIIVGQKQALEMAVRNNRVRTRYSNLCKRIQEEFEAGKKRK